MSTASSPANSSLTARVENDFVYHKPDAEAVERMRVIRDKARELGLLIAQSVPAGREQASALTRLEEAVMHANAGITRPFPASA